MKLWLSKNSEVSLREQLTRQIIFAIVSGDLRADEKLPSTREIALRFKVHQNTVSAAYKKLERDGWVESRKGSGVFVSRDSNERNKSASIRSENELDSLVAQFFRETKYRGFTTKQIETSLKQFLAHPRPDQILVVENDAELRQIIFYEIRTALNFKTLALSLDEFLSEEFSNGAIVVALPEIFEILKTAQKVNNQAVCLKLNSAQAEMTGERKPEPHELIGVASRWETFLRWAKMFLIAAGITGDNIVVRDARERSFAKGFESCALVVADAATSQLLAGKFEIRTFNLIADSSIEELRELVH